MRSRRFSSSRRLFSFFTPPVPALFYRNFLSQRHTVTTSRQKCIAVCVQERLCSCLYCNTFRRNSLSKPLCLPTRFLLKGPSVPWSLYRFTHFPNGVQDTPNFSDVSLRVWPSSTYWTTIILNSSVKSSFPIKLHFQSLVSMSNFWGAVQSPFILPLTGSSGFAIHTFLVIA